MGLGEFAITVGIKIEWGGKMMDQQEEKGFEVNDKRHSAAEETSGSEETTGSEEHREPMEPIQVADMIALFINQMSALAWQRMGLMPDTISGEVNKDLAQARLAIDCVAALVEKLLPSLSETEKRDIQIMVSNLRMNFVKQQEQK
jgi:hypothetical protein